MDSSDQQNNSSLTEDIQPTSNNDVGTTTDASDHTWTRYRFVLLLAGAVAVTIILTVISMTIYTSSGAAQLDLSRPGYRSVSNKVEKNDAINSFSASGSVDKDVINEFIELYTSQAEKTKSVDAFNGDPLNPEVLEFGSASQ